MNNTEIAEKINNGAVGILPTDTIYGLVGNAMDEKVFSKIVRLKNRDSKQKFVVLTPSWNYLTSLGIKTSPEQNTELEKIWPGPTTAVLPAPNSPKFLKASDDTLAVRLPDKEPLLELLKLSGPIIATSVNQNGNPYINSLKEAEIQFPGLDFYIEGDVSNQPSSIIKISLEGSIQKLR